MPIYRLTMNYLADFEGTTSKTYVGDFADYATARAAADAFVTDAQNISNGQIFEDLLTEVTPRAGAPLPGSNVFERISATMNLAGTKRANLQVPAPLPSLFAGNALIITDPLWVAFTDNLASPLWTISDGENVTGTVKGKRVFVRSGSTNLPV